MRALPFILALLTYAAGCKKKEPSAEEVRSNQIAIQAATDSVRIIGELILKGEQVFGKHEKYIFPLLDSVSQSNKIARQFYFKVLGKIVDQSNGYLAESIGSEVIKYIESDPIEFVQNSRSLSDTTFKTMADYSVDQISISTEDQPKAQQEFERLKSGWIKKIEQASAEDKARLNDFLQFMKSSLDTKAVK